MHLRSLLPLSMTAALAAALPAHAESARSAAPTLSIVSTVAGHAVPSAIQGQWTGQVLRLSGHNAEGVTTAVNATLPLASTSFADGWICLKHDYAIESIYQPVVGGAHERVTSVSDSGHRSAERGRPEPYVASRPVQEPDTFYDVSYRTSLLPPPAFVRGRLTYVISLTIDQSVATYDDTFTFSPGHCHDGHRQ